MRHLCCLVFCAGLICCLAGCASPSKQPAVEPLITTIQVEPPTMIAPPLPLSAIPAAPNGDRAGVTSSIARGSGIGSNWPSRWTNAWIPLAEWAQFNGLAAPRALSKGPDALFHVQARHAALILRPGSHTVRLDGLECWLGFAPRLIKGSLHIHALDARKILQPLLNPSLDWLPQGRVIVIDPGHGGRDSGARSCASSRHEKHYTLDWALRLERLLVTNGWKVILTRSNDLEVPLLERVAMAEQYEAQLFISLHFNSADPYRELTGVETYCLTPTGMPSSTRRTEEDDVKLVFPNNAFDDLNLLFGFEMHRGLVRETGAADRGLRHARFMAVLRGQNRPAVLIEGGYLSNPKEAARIATAEYRQMLAQAVAKALQ